jgi:predicted dehydrogenase
MTIRAAIVGSGFMGSAHTEALRRCGVEVVGVAASSPAKSKQAAAALGISRAYDTFDNLLSDATVQVVHILTPNRWHFEMSRQSLLAGKHVMCEKPLAMTAAESAALVKLAEEHPHLAAGVNYNIRFYPLCIELRERIRGGGLGDLFHVSGSYVQDWLLYPHDYNWRVLADEGGDLRAVADIGTHWLDLVQNITGRRIVSVCADLQTVHGLRLRPSGEIETFKGPGNGPPQGTWTPIKTDDYGAILLRFEGGGRGCLWVSQTTAGRKNCLRFEIAGSKHSAAWDSEHPDELWIGHRSQANSVLIRDPGLLSTPARLACGYPGGHNEGYADTFKQSFRAFYGYIAAGDFSAAPPFATFADGHREIQLCEAVLASARERRWVDLPP